MHSLVTRCSAALIFGIASLASGQTLQIDDFTPDAITLIHDSGFGNSLFGIGGVVSNGTTFGPAVAGQTTTVGEMAAFTGSVIQGSPPADGEAISYVVYPDEPDLVRAIVQMQWTTVGSVLITQSEIEVEVTIVSAAAPGDLGTLPPLFAGTGQVRGAEPFFIGSLSFFDTTTAAALGSSEMPQIDIQYRGGLKACALVPAGTTEDFELFDYAQPLSGQGGWTGGADFIIGFGRPADGRFCERSVVIPNTQAAVLRDFGSLAIRRFDFDVQLIGSYTSTDDHFEVEVRDSLLDLRLMEVRFRGGAPGGIPGEILAADSPTTHTPIGLWHSNATIRVGIETLADGNVNIYLDEALAYTGPSIATMLGVPVVGADLFTITQRKSEAPPSVTGYFDNFGMSETPLPTPGPCPDAPPGVTDDFESFTIDELNGQGGWTAPFDVIVTDASLLNARFCHRTAVMPPDSSSARLEFGDRAARRIEFDALVVGEYLDNETEFARIGLADTTAGPSGTFHFAFGFTGSPGAGTNDIFVVSPTGVTQSVATWNPDQLYRFGAEARPGGSVALSIDGVTVFEGTSFLAADFGDASGESDIFLLQQAIPSGSQTRIFFDNLTVTEIAPGDLNDDGLIDGADLGLLLGEWGAGAGAADLNGDGVVDGVDLGILLGGWTG